MLEAQIIVSFLSSMQKSGLWIIGIAACHRSAAHNQYSACDVMTESETDSTKMKIFWEIFADASLPMIWLDVYIVYKRHHTLHKQTLTLPTFRVSSPP